MEFQEFPRFLGWPKNKVYFLENMAMDQADQADQVDPYVVITNEKYERINHVCDICTQRFQLNFDHDEEEWVFKESKEINGVVYHYPLCYEVALEQGKQGKTTRP